MKFVEMYYKLLQVRDEYPIYQSLVEQILLVGFRNQGNIPKEGFEIEGFFNKDEIQKVLTAIGIKSENIVLTQKMNSHYSTYPKTKIVIK